MPSLPELAEIDQLIAAGGVHLDARVACHVSQGGHALPVPVITLGNPDPAVPAFGVFGGVHGLERIGVQVVLAFLRSLVERLPHDRALHARLERMRLVLMPLVNPGGVSAGTRANPQGVDLMRNAPLDAAERSLFMVGGQRLGPGLPWYRGAAGAPMQAESAALCRVVDEELLGHRVSIALDCHSGFGLVDRLWFPWAHTRQPAPHLAEFHALGEALLGAARDRRDRTIFEPQNLRYLAHGDLWDHLYLLAGARPGRLLLPLTLEMGSWRWVHRNPRQALQAPGLFNPPALRLAGVLRRQAARLDRLCALAADAAEWLPVGARREALRVRALARWYGHVAARPGALAPTPSPHAPAGAWGLPWVGR